MAEQGKTTKSATTGRRSATTSETTRTYTAPTTATTREAAATATTALTATTTPPAVPSEPPAPPLPAPSPRNDVRVNVESVYQAMLNASRARSIAHVQRALIDRGFEPGNVTGYADYTTRAAYARYQESVNERPTGLPTAWSLDHLGFDVVG